MSSPADALTTYLNDHDAGAGAALDLMTDLREEREQHAAAAFLATLHEQVAADRKVLENCMDALGVEHQRTKRVLAHLGEKVAELNLAIHGSGGDLALLMGLDTLTSGVAGKLALWQALEALAASDRRLAAFDFATLQDRARNQLDGLERERRAVAVAALSS